MRLLVPAVLIAGLLVPGVAAAAPCTSVATDAALAEAITRRGACVVVEDGTYAPVTVVADGVHLKARKRLGAGFASGTVIVTGSDVIVEGFTFTGSANLRLDNTVGSRITRSLFRSSAAEFVQVHGRKGRPQQGRPQRDWPEGATGSHGADRQEPVHADEHPRRPQLPA